MLPQLSAPLNRKLKAVLRREYRCLNKDRMDWVKLPTGSYHWVTNEVVALEMEQIKLIYKLIFKEDFHEHTV